jgi:hypothetical protein
METEFDFGIGLASQKPKRGRPAGKTPRKIKSAQGSHTNSGPLSINTLDNIYIDDSKDIDLLASNKELASVRSLKDELTEKELNFINNYLIGGVTIENAMKSAGYVGYHLKSLYRIGRKIVEKYESRAGDHRKIARAIGAGEVTVLRGLLDLAQNARAEAVRCKAWEALASCLGLKSEPVESFQGMQIVIRGEEPSPGPGPGQVDGQPARPALPPPLKPQQVTK